MIPGFKHVGLNSEFKGLAAFKGLRAKGLQVFWVSSLRCFGLGVGVSS